MEPDVCGQIFDPFFSTKPGGNGIGLAVVNQIVTSLGGRIDVSSQPGQGTRFDVWLPRATAGSAQPAGQGGDWMPSSAILR